MSGSVATSARLRLLCTHTLPLVVVAAVAAAVVVVVACCCCCLFSFFLVHSPAAALDAKCIWAKTTEQTCRRPGLSRFRGGVGVALAWLAVARSAPAPSPLRCSYSSVIKRAVALEPPVAGIASVSGFGECILSRLVGRSVCLRQLQITLSDSIVLRLGDLQWSPPKTTTTTIAAFNARQTERERGRLADGADRQPQTVTDLDCDSKLQRRRCCLNPKLPQG